MRLSNRLGLAMVLAPFVGMILFGLYESLSNAPGATIIILSIIAWFMVGAYLLERKS